MSADTSRCPLCLEALDDDDPIPVEAARKLLETQACLFCGGYHEGACPRIKSATWTGEQPSQTEFWPDGQWCRHRIVSRAELEKLVRVEAA